MKVLILFFAMSIFTLNSGIDENSGKEVSQSSQQQPLFSFGIIADIQYCDCATYNTRFYRNSLQKLRDAVNELKKGYPSFIINLGDIIDRDYVSLEPVLNIFDSTDVRIYHTLGNHDFSLNKSEKNKILKLTGSSKGYYSFRHKGFRFIILNGNEIATYSPSQKGRNDANELLADLKSRNAPNAFEWNGGISDEQIKWMRTELDASAAIGEKVFLLCHFPIWPEAAHNLLNYEKVLDITSQYDHIIAWLNGHNHDGSYGNFSMIHFVTFRGMVETETNNSFAMVEVYNNKIWIKGYGREKSQILAY